MTTTKRDEVEAVALEALIKAWRFIMDTRANREPEQDATAVLGSLASAIAALDESLARDKGDGEDAK